MDIGFRGKGVGISGLGFTGFYSELSGLGYCPKVFTRGQAAMMLCSMFGRREKYYPIDALCVCSGGQYLCYGLKQANGMAR